MHTKATCRIDIGKYLSKTLSYSTSHASWALFSSASHTFLASHSLSYAILTGSYLFQPAMFSQTAIFAQPAMLSQPAIFAQLAMFSQPVTSQSILR